MAITTTSTISIPFVMVGETITLPTGEVVTVAANNHAVTAKGAIFGTTIVDTEGVARFYAACQRARKVESFEDSPPRGGPPPRFQHHLPKDTNTMDDTILRAILAEIVRALVAGLDLDEAIADLRMDKPRGYTIEVARNREYRARKIGGAVARAETLDLIMGKAQGATQARVYDAVADHQTALLASMRTSGSYFTSEINGFIDGLATTLGDLLVSPRTVAVLVVLVLAVLAFLTPQGGAQDWQVETSTGALTEMILD